MNYFQAKPRLLITGGNGQLAHAITNHPQAHEFQLIACSRTDLDITHADSITNAIIKHQPLAIINTAAYTAVDKAESEHELAFLANHVGAKNLAMACQSADIPLLHLSTDYVFNGDKSTPFREDDAVNPINVYGESKWQGEQAIRQYCQNHFIIRVSGVFSTYGNNFYNTLQRLSRGNSPIRIVNDQITCPTSANDIAGMLLTLATIQTHYGTYHYCSTPPVSWHGFAQSVLKQTITPITTAEYPTAAKRPSYSALNCQKIQSTFGIQQPSWEQALCKLQ